MQCCVPFCRSSADTVSEAAGITFHEFPSEVYLRAAWLRAIGKQDSPLPDSAVVCSRHFLIDDIYETDSGLKKIHSGAIPSTVQVCMICLDTHSKLFLMSKYKLDEAYEHLVGHNLYDQGYLKRTLCVQCAQRLVNFSKFRDKSLRANSLMMALVERHKLITIQHLEAVNEVRNELKYNIGKTVLEPDHCDLHIDCSDVDSLIDVDATSTCENISVKTEQPVPMSVDEDHAEHVVRNEDAAKNLNINLVVTKEEYLSDEEPNQMTDPLLVKPSTSKEQPAGAVAPIKYEITFECSICSEEFADEDAYNYHMTRHMEESQDNCNPAEEDLSAEYSHSSDTAEDAKILSENLLPSKSREKYEKAYDDLVKWNFKTGRKEKSFSENDLLEYFNDLSKTKMPSTLWCEYSKLKTTIRLKENVDIGDYENLCIFLKQKSEGYTPKKSKVLSGSNIEKFLKEAPDEQYLLEKAVLIFGVNGACRSNEMSTLTTKDVETKNNRMLVRLRCTKNEKGRIFTVQDEFLRVVQKYQKLRPVGLKSDRFFLNFKYGKCTKQVLGRHKIAAIPKRIATYLKLPDAESYTGHCFRRSSATLLADTGANLTTLTKHGGWLSSKVAKGYIDESMENKAKMATRTYEVSNTSLLVPRPSTSRAQHSTN